MLDKKNGLPDLETERLRLRAFSPSDAPAALKLFGNRRANTFLPWFPTESLEEAESFLQQRFLMEAAAPGELRYAICPKGDDEPIGYVAVDGGEEHDLGYGLRSDCWCRGIATEAVQAVVSHVRSMGGSFLTATHDVRNPRSGAVMRRVGMTYRYSYVEDWQPKDKLVTFRMYQIDFAPGVATYTHYGDLHGNMFVEECP